MNESRRKWLADTFRSGVNLVDDVLGAPKEERSPVSPSSKQETWIVIGSYRDLASVSGMAVNSGRQYLRSDECGIRVEEFVDGVKVNRPLRLDGTGKVWINTCEVWEEGAFLAHSTGQMKFGEA